MEIAKWIADRLLLEFGWPFEGAQVKTWSPTEYLFYIEIRNPWERGEDISFRCNEESQLKKCFDIVDKGDHLLPFQANRVRGVIRYDKGGPVYFIYCEKNIEYI